MKKRKILNYVSLILLAGMICSSPVEAQNLSQSGVSRTELAKKWVIMQAACKGAVLPWLAGAAMEAVPVISLGQWIYDEKTGFYGVDQDAYSRRRSLKQANAILPTPLMGGAIGTVITTIAYGGSKLLTWPAPDTEFNRSYVSYFKSTIPANWSHTQQAHEKWFGKNSACDNAEWNYLRALASYEKNLKAQQAVAARSVFTGKQNKKALSLKATPAAAKQLVAKSNLIFRFLSKPLRSTAVVR